jgi:signal transduction histidine kinase
VRTERGEMVVGAVFDVTERRELEERQRATQRLEVVGQLTAGIAHNFNNLLMGIVPSLEMASKAAPAELLPLLQVAEQSAQRAASVVRQLMTYASRNHARSRRNEAMVPLVEGVVAFCRTTLDRRIALDLRCEDAGYADVDPFQIEQALLNLLINARDALDEGGAAAPSIQVVVEGVAAGAPELEGHTGAHAGAHTGAHTGAHAGAHTGAHTGEWVAIRVVDNGIGMDAATAQRIYEPFFTTKPAGKGTGLGLATTQAILRDHGGFVTCRSAPGQGAAFALYLPRTRGTRRAAPGPT